MVKVRLEPCLESIIKLFVMPLALGIALLSGCETLKPVEPEATSKPVAKATETEGPISQKPEAPKRKASPKGLARNMDHGGRQPTVQKPDAPSAPAPQPKSASQPAPKPSAGVEAVPIPPETDSPSASNINEILERNPIDEKADQLVTTVGKIASGRVQLMQLNGDMKPRYHMNHDEILYVVKGKGILTIDEDRHVAAAGAVFIIPRRAVYGLQNTGEKPFVALAIEVPPGDPKDTWTPKAR